MSQGDLTLEEKVTIVERIAKSRPWTPRGDWQDVAQDAKLILWRNGKMQDAGLSEADFKKAANYAVSTARSKAWQKEKKWDHNWDQGSEQRLARLVDGIDVELNCMQADLCQKILSSVVSPEDQANLVRKGAGDAVSHFEKMAPGITAAAARQAGASKDEKQRRRDKRKSLVQTVRATFAPAIIGLVSLGVLTYWGAERNLASKSSKFTPQAAVSHGIMLASKTCALDEEEPSAFA